MMGTRWVFPLKFMSLGCWKFTWINSLISISLFWLSGIPVVNCGTSGTGLQISLSFLSYPFYCTCWGPFLILSSSSLRISFLLFLIRSLFLIWHCVLFIGLCILLTFEDVNDFWDVFGFCFSHSLIVPAYSRFLSCLFVLFWFWVCVYVVFVFVFYRLFWSHY